MQKTFVDNSFAPTQWGYNTEALAEYQYCFTDLVTTLGVGVDSLSISDQAALKVIFKLSLPLSYNSATM